MAVLNLTHRLVDTVVVGGRAPIRGLRRVFLAMLMGLVVQFVLGMILNLYVQIPPAASREGFIREVETAPLALTLHVVLGLLLIVAALIALIRAVRAARRGLTGLTAAGLGALLGAFAEGELFVRQGRGSESLTMAVLTGVALACYIHALARTTLAPSQQGTTGASRAHSEPEGTQTPQVPRQAAPSEGAVPRQTRP